MVVNRDDVGMAQTAGQIGFTAEARDAIFILAQQNLNCGKPLGQHTVAAFPYLRGRPTAELVLQDVIADVTRRIDHPPTPAATAIIPSSVVIGKIALGSWQGVCFSCERIERRRNVM